MDDEGRFDARISEFVTAQQDPEVVAAWVERITSLIFDSFPDMAADPVLRATAHRTAEDQWTAFLASVTEPERDTPVLAAAAEGAVQLARRGGTLQQLFAVYRIGRRGVWEYITSVLRQESGRDGDSLELLVFLWDRASHWLDTVVESSAVVFEDERDQVRLGAAAQRLQIVREILDGRPPTTDPQALSEALNGYPISGHHTAMVLSATDADRVSRLRGVALELAMAADAPNPLLARPGGLELWAWLATAGPPSLDRLLTAQPDLTGMGVRIAVGAPGEGLEGFRQSHADARDAHRIASTGRLPANPVYYPDVEALVMLRQSGDRAARFVQRTLGALGGTGETHQRLRQTARAVLQAGSMEEAAGKLFVHKNTVRYRLAQVEELLGHPLSDAPVALGLALEYHATFMADEQAASD